MTDVTRLFNALEHGDPHAASRLLPLGYEEHYRGTKPETFVCTDICLASRATPLSSWWP
jgi:hypothetical protein